jgi:CRP-like cAMP-binding protein
MGGPVPQAADALVRKLQSQSELSEQDVQRVRELPVIVKTLGPGEPVVREGDRPNHCGLIISGLAYRCKFTDEGKRQILSLHIAGDVPDLQSIYLHVMDHDVRAQTHCTIGLIPHQPLRELLDRCPSVMRILWRETLVEGAILREWIINVGRRNAERRLAHMLLELYRRMEAVGLASDFKFALQMTQAELADATGLTVVHINRVLRVLREAGIMEFRKNLVNVLDRHRFIQVADFSPVYLHQHPAL